MSSPVTPKTIDSFTSFSNGPLEVALYVLGEDGVFGVSFVAFDPEVVACEMTDDFGFVWEKVVDDEVEDAVVDEAADEVTSEWLVVEASGTGDEVGELEADEVANEVENEGTDDKPVVETDEMEDLVVGEEVYVAVFGRAVVDTIPKKESQKK